MNNCMDIENPQSKQIPMNNSKEELRVILKQCCGCLVEKHIIKM